MGEVCLDWGAWIGPGPVLRIAWEEISRLAMGDKGSQRPARRTQATLARGRRPRKSLLLNSLTVVAPLRARLGRDQLAGRWAMKEARRGRPGGRRRWRRGGTS
jgi:hypothetical protein